MRIKLSIGSALRKREMMIDKERKKRMKIDEKVNILVY